MPPASAPALGPVAPPAVVTVPMPSALPPAAPAAGASSSRRRAAPASPRPPAAVRAVGSSGPRGFVEQSADWIEDARAGRRSRIFDPLRATGREPTGQISTGSGASATASAGAREPPGPARTMPGHGSPAAPSASTGPGPTATTTPARTGREPSGALATHGREPSGVVQTQGPTTPRSRTGTSPGPTGSHVKGSLVLAAMQCLEETRGVAALERALALLDLKTRQRLSGMILPVTWISLVDYDALLDAMERAHGSGNGAIAFGTGAATAEKDLRSTHKAVMESLSPVAALERLPQIWRAYHSDGDVTVEQSGTGAWRIDVGNLEHDTFLHAMAMSGFIKRMLELSGARDVRCTLLACRGRGDDRTTLAIRLR